MIANGLAAWLSRHPKVKQRQLAAKVPGGGIDPALLSKYLNAEKWDGSVPWNPTNMVIPRDANALRLEAAMRKLDPADFVSASYWSVLRLDRAKVQGRRGRRPGAVKAKRPARRVARAAVLPAA